MKSENVVKEEKALKLLDDYRHGNQNAFTALYNLYVVSLLNYGSCLTSDRELVKDCVHDVFVKLLTKCKSQKITKVGSYLFISLRNRLTDEFRHYAFSTDTPITDLKVKRYDESAEAKYIENEHDERMHANVVKLFRELTPRQQKAFKLYFIEQRKYDEICEILNMNYPCVRNLVHRGMLKLRSSETYQQLKTVAD